MSLKAPFMIHADLECLVEKMHSCQNYHEKSYTEKKLSMHLLVTHRFQIVRLMKKENKLDCYKGEDYTMKSKTIVITPKNLQ